jgi:glycine/D-amino acid oxidase-like deaminating enzyme
MVEMQAYDVAVVGLGAMGSAALYAAARRGLRVIGFDRLGPGHNRSSSFGESRGTRHTSRFFAAPVSSLTPTLLNQTA